MIPYITEPIWTQLLPVSGTSQYILHWYIAETLPPSLDLALTQKTAAHGGAYQIPMRFQDGMTLRERVQLDVRLDISGKLGGKWIGGDRKAGGGTEVYHEPIRHAEREIVQEEEKAYESQLVPWEEAVKLLGVRSVSADVVRRGWTAVEERLQMEEKTDLGRMGL